MKFIPIIVITILLMGAFNSSCKHYGTDPQDSTKCDTCCDTCYTPCDTCNLNRDSLSHAFTWTEYTIPDEASLTGAWVFSDTDIHIVGNSLWKFDGNSFREISARNITYDKPMNGAMNGLNIFGFDKDDYWMVYTSLAFHASWEGHFEDLRFGAVNACWGPSSNDMFFVGNGGHIHHYNGTKFDTMVSGTIKSIGTISGTDNQNIWAAGWNSSQGQSIVLHYDGNTWTEDPFSTSGQARDWGIGSVWCTDSAGHKVTVISGSTVFRKTDNGPWRSDSDHVGNKLNDGGYIGLGVTGNNATDFIAVGGWGFVAHWNGKDWKKYDQLFDYGNSAYGALAMSMKGNTIAIVGVKSGQSWVAIGKRKQ